MSATLPFFPCTFRPTPTPRARLTTAIICQWTPPRRPRDEPVPARDRVIDFGKHKGKMLGAVPSLYLKWMSRKLRVTNETWAQLADEVLADPIYRDRIEWEFWDRVRTGDRGMVHECGVTRLMEIKERFGWDFEDRAGWKKIKFDLLGTSHGGRIPKIKEGVQAEAAVVEEEEREEEEVDVAGLSGRARRRVKRKGRREVEVREGKLGVLMKGRGSLGNLQAMGDGGDKKDGRVENSGGYDTKEEFPGREGRSGFRRGSLGNAHEMGDGGGVKRGERVESSGGHDTNKEFPGREGRLGFSAAGRGSSGNSQEKSGDEKGDRTVESSSGLNDINRRFPGRETLLRKAQNLRKFYS